MRLKNQLSHKLDLQEKMGLVISYSHTLGLDFLPCSNEKVTSETKELEYFQTNSLTLRTRCKFTANVTVNFILIVAHALCLPLDNMSANITHSVRASSYSLKESAA